jgi:hypothetical protein
MQQMLLEAQQLQDAVLEARCRMAVTANRLVRLDNPIAAAQLAAMQVRFAHVVSSRVKHNQMKFMIVCLYCAQIHMHAQHRLGRILHFDGCPCNLQSDLCCGVALQARAERMLRECQDVDV